MGAAEAKTIRETLKAKGLSNRKVSVRADSYSMGSSVYVTVKDPSVDLAMVEEIANREESIRRCEFSGEILSGGNTYVHVRYSREAEAAIAAEYTERVKAAYDKVDGSILEPVEGTKAMIGKDGVGNATVWHESEAGCMGVVWTNPEDLSAVAFKVALLVRELG